VAPATSRPIPLPVFEAAPPLEPYRLLFPLGVLAGLIGAGAWPLHALGWLPWPGALHRALMMQGFEHGFVLGFLLTAIPGLTRGRLGREDIEPVIATLAGRAASTLVVGVSVGAGPALLAAADPRVRERVGAVLTLGGYASAREVVRFWLTGAYDYAGVRGRVDHDPELVRTFVRANADRLAHSARTLLEAVDRDAAERLLAAPPPDLQRYLDSLSPLRVARDIRARLVLVHGRADRAVPYTESLRLAAARPERTTLVLVGVVEHVEGRGASGWRGARDFLALWRVMYALRSGA